MCVSSSSRLRIDPELARDVRQRFERARVLALVLEEARVLDGHRDVRGELPQHLLVGFRELADGVAEQVERADDAPLAPQRDDELGVRAGHRFDVARIRVDVVHEQRLPFLHGGADEAVPDLHAQRARDVVRVADRIRDRQLVALGVEQIHRERLKLGQPGDELRDLLQQIVEVEHRRDFAPEREERRQGFGGADGRGGRFGHSKR